MSILAPNITNSSKPPGSELGAESQNVGGVHGWASFVDEQEYVPELAWPSSIWTYHRMRSDSQIEALHVGTVQPVREYRWSIDPNGAPAKLAEQAAGDLGLPIRGHEDDNIVRGPRLFDFDSFLDDVLLAPLYGHFHFEIVGDQQGSAWHMSKLAPRHPRTLMEFQSNTVGDLLGIRQNIGGATDGWIGFPPAIPASKLVPFVWRKEAGSHVGRSQLRALYREWLVKDRTIRIAAINLERAGGMPIIEGPQGASDQQLRDLANLARSFKVAEGGGGAIPFGSKLNLVGGHVPDAISLLKYCDDCMARVWALMLVQLGMTSTGNRALGAEFAIYAARAQRAMAKWVCRAVNEFLDRYTEWNLGPSANHAPLLHYEQAKPDGLSLADMVALIEAGALNVDPELESWIRSEGGLPPAPPAPSVPGLGDLSPEEVALIQSSRNPPVLPGAANTMKPQLPSTGVQPNVDSPTFASAATAPSLFGALSMPDRTLRRKPYEHELRSKVDLRALDTSHNMVLQAVQDVFNTQIIPSQIDAIGEQVLTTQSGKPRTTVTKAAMASLAAPLVGRDTLIDHLTSAARAGAHAAAGELAAQGVQVDVPDDQKLRARVGDIASAATSITAASLSLAAQRKAASLAGGGRSPDMLRTDLTDYLTGLKHQWSADQLQGAVTAAQNVGRIDVFNSAPTGTALKYYASEILDLATCTECIAVDGTEYPDLQAAEQDYSSGGFNDCAGGPRCRGTLVAVYEGVNQNGDPTLIYTDFG